MRAGTIFCNILVAGLTISLLYSVFKMREYKNKWLDIVSQIKNGDVE